MKTVDHILLGGNVASLIAASELVKQKKSVALVAPPASIGGHFSTHAALGYEFDLGMLLLELDSYQTQSNDLAEYDPATVAGSGRFNAFIEKTINRHFTIREVKQIEVALSNQRIGDYYISNDLTGLKGIFTPQQIDRINQELNDCVITNHLHPSTKSTSPLFDQADYEEASVSNHGETLHKHLIEPLVKRATNLTSQAMLARYHRLFWAPLYYPETLQQAFEGSGISALRPTVFHHPVGNAMGDISSRLLDEISSSDSFTLVPSLEHLAETDAGWVVNNTIQTTKIASSLPQNILTGLLGLTTQPLSRSSYLIVLLKVEGEVDCEVLFNAGDRGDFFRIVNQSRLRGEQQAQSYLSVEYNLDLVNAIDPQYVTRQLFLEDIRSFFEEYNLGELRLISFSVLELKNKIVFPDAENVGRVLQNTKRIDGISMELMGPSLGISASSLNDQILQALKYTQLTS